MKIISALILATLTAASSAQTKTGVIVGTATPTTAISFAELEHGLGSVESVENGVYRFQIVDDLNQFRCYVTSSTPVHPGNVLHNEVDSVTIVCVSPHKVESK